MELKNTTKVSESVTVSQIEGTIFRVLEESKEEERIYRIIIGNKIATQKWYKSLEEVEEEINKTNWDLVTSCILAIIEFSKTQMENTENTNTNQEKSE